MPRLIDANALKEKINTAFFSEIGKIIDNAPTIEPNSEAEHAYYKGWSNGEEAEASRHPKWIPCEERLPEPRREVWVYAEGAYGVGYYDDDWCGWFDTDCVEINVDAWMPLPPYHIGEATEMVEQTDCPWK